MTIHRLFAFIGLAAIALTLAAAPAEAAVHRHRHPVIKHRPVVAAHHVRVSPMAAATSRHRHTTASVLHKPSHVG